MAGMAHVRTDPVAVDDLGALAERMDAAHQASLTRHHGM